MSLKKYQVSQIVWDFKQVPNKTYYTATIGKNSIEGLVHREGTYLYFCFDNPRLDCEGSHLGFPHSRGFDVRDIKTDGELQYAINVKNLAFPTQPKNFVAPPVLPEFAEYRPIIRVGYVEFGCQRVTNNQILALVKSLLPKTAGPENTTSFPNLAGRFTEICPGYVQVGYYDKVSNSKIRLLAKHLKS